MKSFIIYFTKICYYLRKKFLTFILPQISTFCYYISTSSPSTVFMHHATLENTWKLKTVVKNMDTMLQCEECDKWRLVFLKEKLNKQKQESLMKLLESISYRVDFSGFYPLPLIIRLGFLMVVLPGGGSRRTCLISI